MGFIICIFADKDENNRRILKRVFYRGLTNYLRFTIKKSKSKLELVFGKIGGF